MNETTKKPVIGILGGISSGKSTVAEEFAKLHCGIIDADKIAHELLRTDSVKKQIAQQFGQNVFDPTGEVNKKKLADAVFDNEENLSRINAIIHPSVLTRAEEMITNYNRDPEIAAIVLDMPLLMEVGWEKRCEKLIFVACNKQNRLKRAQQKPHFHANNQKNVKKRQNFQISLDKKAKIAHYVVDNNSGREILIQQITDIFSNIVNTG